MELDMTIENLGSLVKSQLSRKGVARVERNENFPRPNMYHTMSIWIRGIGTDADKREPVTLKRQF